MNFNDLEVDTFLKEFYKDGIFNRKIKIYCEFVDVHKGNIEMMTSLHYKIKDLRFENYYNFYGTERIKAVGYKEKPLRQGIEDRIKATPLSEQIYYCFSRNERYSLKAVKEKLKEIYMTLGISKAPKANDLEEYYEVKKILLYDSVTKKREAGYEVIRVKL